MLVRRENFYFFLRALIIISIGFLLPSISLLSFNTVFIFFSSKVQTIIAYYSLIFFILACLPLPHTVSLHVPLTQTCCDSVFPSLKVPESPPWFSHFLKRKRNSPITVVYFDLYWFLWIFVCVLVLQLLLYFWAYIQLDCQWSYFSDIKIRLDN